jgi:hypothetical protein
VKVLRGISPVFKYAFLIALALPAGASAADYIAHRHHGGLLCHYEQSGERYCVQAPPVEKLISDCSPGVDCHHMQSGQHYSVQRPARLLY